ncbi:uncharacterized protein FIESC28_05310 [Fusarium coffeatum]|uniref:D-lactate dehydrogenase (cytochrome) n=1 Tax=Fusarium coffeatum TaxID=231269 RepID=A0A366RV54_9HYPO|nr:uncharacterized protein FIESC28_05310 [Fusarium coffeatum]RBR20346.1 hypothetical protein FIESC28_05310 [Fusarium coffeatum]
MIIDSDRSTASTSRGPEESFDVTWGAASSSSPSQSLAQPSVVGESWYASYVMRGYTPGHSSVHRPIGDCSETVQDVTCTTRTKDSSSNQSQPLEKPGMSDPPRPELVDALMKAYFDRFHTFCPILDRKAFFTSLHDGTVSVTLLRSVLFVASLHCDLEVLHHMGHSTRLDANHKLFTDASASFDMDRDSSRVDMILSSYLLHYWFGNPTAYRDCHWWIAAAIRSAQCTGYHRSTANSQMPSERRSRWKRIWWCLYVRDRQIAISTGTPMVINDMDYDVEELVVEDLADEPIETAQYIVAQVKLNKAVCYHYYLINIYQRLQRQCNRSRETKPVLDAATKVFDLVENSLLYWTPEQFPMIYVSALFSAMMALAVDGSTAAPKGDQIFGKIRRGLLALKQFEPVYNLAKWIRNFFMDIISRSEQEGRAHEQEPAANQSGDPSGGSNETEEMGHSLPAIHADPASFPTSGMGLEDPTFMLDTEDNTSFWPEYMANGVFSSTHSGEAMDFPQPDSTQYQAISRAGLYILGLATIGAAGSFSTVDWSRNTLFNFFSVEDAKSIEGLRKGVLNSIHSRPSTQSLENTGKIDHDTSPANIQAACKEFAAILGPENVSTDQADLITHSGSDYQSYAWTEETAICSHVILYPETTEQVSELMKVCFRRKIPVTPYSGGTSIEGQYIPHLQGICIDFTRMSNIVELNKHDLDCVVQPGIGWMDLNEELATHGLFFPPDPGPGAMIGGMVGTGCSGTNAAAYGTMKDWVLSLTVVLADGTIIKTRQRARKSSAGYDLTRTFIGSEGTLGLVTEATLKLSVKPPCEAVAVCTFPSLRDAASAVRDVLSAGIQVAAVEILDDVQMKSINDSALTTIKWKEEPTLFFKFTGSDDFIVQHLAKQVGGITKHNRSTEYTFASDENERNELWSARKNALWSMIAMKKSPTDKVWTTDVAVPMSRLPDIIDFAKADIEKSGLLGSIVGHVGDGNFHTLLLFPEDKRHVAEGIVHRMVDKAIEMEGTATGEHGVGLVKRDYLEKELGKETVDAMRSMKNAFDPMCILNCDKVIRMQAAE